MLDAAGIVATILVVLTVTEVATDPFRIVKPGSGELKVTVVSALYVRSAARPRLGSTKTAKTSKTKKYLLNIPFLLHN